MLGGIAAARFPYDLTACQSMGTPPGSEKPPSAQDNGLSAQWFKPE
jgi:hypothetical protein